MGRYSTKTTDKAEQLEKWVQKLAEEANKNLDGSELYDISLNLRDPFEVSGQKYNNGFVGVHIRFASKEPDFLTENDKEFWYLKMKELAEKRFKLDLAIGGLEYASISFEEPSEEELYLLTSNKESTIRDGFDRIRRYVEWYRSAVNDYAGVVQAHNERMREHLVNLETLSK
jgi:hypothetical protein